MPVKINREQSGTNQSVETEAVVNNIDPRVSRSGKLQEFKGSEAIMEAFAKSYAERGIANPSQHTEHSVEFNSGFPDAQATTGERSPLIDAVEQAIEDGTLVSGAIPSQAFLKGEIVLIDAKADEYDDARDNPVRRMALSFSGHTEPIFSGETGDLEGWYVDSYDGNLTTLLPKDYLHAENADGVPLTDAELIDLVKAGVTETEAVE